MPYTDPEEVVYPRTRASSVRPVANQEASGWSAALLHWDRQPALGLRWNGAEEEGGKIHPGNPQSRGLPTWFIIPDEFVPAILQALLERDLLGGGRIDKDEAKERVVDALGESRGSNAHTVANLEQRVREIVIHMREAGEI
jgi:hypothetical protein